MIDTDLARRVEKLERENRRLKRMALLPLVLIAGLGTMYIASCSTRGKPGGQQRDFLGSATRIPDRVTAREFDVVDSSGRVRIRLKSENPIDRQEIAFLSSTGKERIVLDQDDEIGSLQFMDGDGNDTVRITGSPWPADLSAIELFAGKAVGSAGITSTGPGTKEISLSVNYLGQPNIELADGEGFKMDLGSVDLQTIRTGETHQTSAASIVMFGNDKEHHVIWRAPQP